MLETIPGGADDEQMEGFAFWGSCITGVRSWGPDDISGIVYIDSDWGYEGGWRMQVCQSAGRCASVYVPGEERSDVSPVRYVLTPDDLDTWFLQRIRFRRESADRQAAPQKLENDADVSMLDESRGYRLTVLDAAAGIRFVWTGDDERRRQFMEDTQSGSFDGETRCVRRISLNESLGIIALSHSGGPLAELYRTGRRRRNIWNGDTPAWRFLEQGKRCIPARLILPGMPYERVTESPVSGSRTGGRTVIIKQWKQRPVPVR